MNHDSVNLIYDPVWPWSLPPFGLWVMTLVALLLVGLTVWTYVGASGSNSRRLFIMLGVRLGALALTCFMLVRPSLAFREEMHLPSTLIFLLDASESMTFQDEYDSQSRWDAMRRILRESESELTKLREDHNVSILFYQFAGDVQEFDSRGKADGKRTDIGQALATLFASHSRDRNLRGLLLFSDGADNGTIPDRPLTEAAKWRRVPCPIHTFGLGQSTVADRQRDIAITAITPEPSPVAVKGKLTIKALIDAPGFENAAVNLHLFFDDVQVLIDKKTLPKTTGNEVKLTVDAPAKPGEVKVTLKVDPLPGEVTKTNNEIGTFVTVTKEGVSVLLVDKLRVFEPQAICDALAPDPRIRLYVAWRRTDLPDPLQADLFQLDKQHYDVIILGDVSAKRLSAGNPLILERIRELVKDKGTGLMMMGGYDTFGNGDWRGTPLEEVLPVQLDAGGQVDGDVAMKPTRDGLNHYLMRLSEHPLDNEALWAKLPKLDGMTRVGKEKPGFTVLATRGNKGEPVLVSHHYGSGRVLAFAGDTTHRWKLLGQPKTSEGLEAHARFWKQVVLWLAKQDEADGNAWVKPDMRRLPSGNKLGFSLGLRGKGGIELKDAQFEAKVTGPKNAEFAVPTAREQNGERGIFWKTDVPGEYRLVVKARGKDVDGKDTSGEANARFLVYQDDAEMMRRAADHDFLDKLAKAGGGSLHRAQELPQFLKDLQKTPQAANKPKSSTWPDWRTNATSGFPVALLVLFVGLLGTEWFLRRIWGMV